MVPLVILMPRLPFPFTFSPSMTAIEDPSAVGLGSGDSAVAFASTSLASASAGFSSALGGEAAVVGSLRGREGFASAPDGPGSAPASGRRVLFFFGTESFLCFASCSSRLSVFSSGGGAWS